MFRRIGHPVLKLRRVAIGPLEDRHLPLGQLRSLTPEEVRALLSSSHLVKRASGGARP
jgi:23S rRNA pseudouridine2605 synthase